MLGAVVITKLIVSAPAMTCLLVAMYNFVRFSDPPKLILWKKPVPHFCVSFAWIRTTEYVSMFSTEMGKIANAF